MEKRAWQTRRATTTNSCDSRHVLLTVCFAQIVISATQLTLLVTSLAPEHILLSLNSHLLLFSRLAAGALTALFTASLATVISVWVCFPPLLLASTAVVMVLLTALTLALTGVVQLQGGVWSSSFSAGYATNNDVICPGIDGGFCCGWDHCPYSLCQFAHRQCDSVVTHWVRSFFLKTLPMLSLMLTLGMLQVGLGFHRLRQWWRW